MEVLLTIAEGKILNYCYSNLYYAYLIFFISLRHYNQKSIFYKNNEEKQQ